MDTDLRLTPGAHIHCPVSRVLRPNDAKNRFGTGYKTKSLDGRVVKVKTETKNKRNYKYLTCLFDIGQSTKVCTLPLSGVKSGLSSYPERQPSYKKEDPFHFLAEEYKKPCSPHTPQGNKQNKSSQSENELERNNGCVQREVNSAEQPAPISGHSSTEHLTQTASPVKDLNVPDGEAVFANGQKWKENDIEGYINGYVRPITCRIKGPDTSIISRGTANSSMSIFDFFMWMFPLPHLSLIVELTNKRLNEKSLKLTTSGELLRFFGTLVLMTRCKFSDRRELWGESDLSQILGSPKFGVIMSRSRFQNLRTCIQFSKQRDMANLYTEQNQWQLCEDFIEAINHHRRENIIPTEYLCVDESISRWYGLGGSWIDAGSPHYVKLERKPEYGLEMQDIACGGSGILLGIQLVKSAKEMQRSNSSTNHNNGTRVLLDLCEPWCDRERIVCADSFFASVEAAEILLKKNLRFIGIIKTATRRFPVSYFSHLEMFKKGDYNSLHTTVLGGDDGKPRHVVSLCWLDRNRRLFVSTTGRTSVTVSQQRVRSRQHEDGACPVEVEIPMPECVKEYYKVAGIIDTHNRIRQDSLDLEKTIEVKDWSFRINCSLLGMIATDAWLLYKYGTAGRSQVKPHMFWAQLGKELVYNSFDNVGICRRPIGTGGTILNEGTRSEGCGLGMHLTPTKKPRREGSKNSRVQKRCGACPPGKRKKSSWICSHCRDMRNVEVYICHTLTGRRCFAKHVVDYH